MLERQGRSLFFDSLTSIPARLNDRTSRNPPRSILEQLPARAFFLRELLPFRAGLLKQNHGGLMADKVAVEKDEVVVDERIMEGSLIAPFVWISAHIWGEILGTLPIELRLEVEQTCKIQGS